MFGIGHMTYDLSTNSIRFFCEKTLPTKEQYELDYDIWKSPDEGGQQRHVCVSE